MSFSSIQKLIFGLGILSLLAFIEDALFFVICRCPIRPGIYTTKWGYVEIQNL